MLNSFVGSGTSWALLQSAGVGAHVINGEPVVHEFASLSNPRLGRLVAGPANGCPIDTIVVGVRPLESLHDV